MSSPRARSATDSVSGFPCDGSVSRIEGPAGGIETVIACPAAHDAVSATAVICHPNPVQGGTLHNKVVHTLARAFGDLGLRTVRFNFRGVGASEGRFDNGRGESDDAVAVLEWVRARRAQDEIWLAGFSFGAYIGLRVSARWPVTRVITVAPPVDRDDIDVITPPPCPWLMIQGSEDDVVPAPGIRALVARTRPAPAYIELAGAGHFFHGRLTDLRAHITAALAPHRPPSEGDGSHL
jgi:hypothetical protein